MGKHTQVPRHKRVANHLLILIVPPIIIFTIALGVTLGWLEQSSEAQRIRAYHNNIHQQLAELLAEPLFFFEYRLVETIAGTAIKSSDIDYIQIRDDIGNQVAALGEIKGPLIHGAIHYRTNDQPARVIGRLDIAFNQQQGRTGLRAYATPLFVSLLSLLLLIALLYGVWSKVISNPLEQLRLAMANSEGGAEHPVHLSRNDEFGLIANTYNNMLTRVSQHRYQLEKRDALFQMLYHKTPALMFSLDSEGHIIRASKYLGSRLGYPEEHLLGTNLNDLLIHPVDLEKASLLESNNRIITIKCFNGSTLSCILNLITEPNDQAIYLGVLHDVTAEQQANKKLEHLANYDQLTQLLNHRSFESKVKFILRTDPKEHWFLFIDIDRFKWINDSYGHPTGDEILKVIATRLRAALPDAVISRFGGDEFVAFIKASQPINYLLSHIKTATNQRITFSTSELSPSLCIGAAHYPEHAGHYEELLQKADAAMYQAKISGRNAECIYNDLLDEHNRQHNKVVEILQSIVHEETIDVHFQPIIDSTTQKMVSAEALLRITNENVLNIPIGLFLQVAEESGYIRQIDRLARRKSLSYLKRWRSLGLHLDELHINISALNFSRDDFIDEIAADLNEFGLEAASLVLELTESVFIDNPQNAIRQLHQLKAMGVRIALDDFGTGYSSLSMLTSFPVDILKLDQSFFQGRHIDNKYLLVKQVIGMAQSLNMSTIAEGIESPEVIEELQAAGCPLIQGYWYSRPLSSADFERLYLQPAAQSHS